SAVRRIEMTEPVRPLGVSSARTLPEALARTVRHDVGNLLQKLYVTVALLQERLPPESQMERRVLAELKARGQECKEFLDRVHDLVCPLGMSPESVDLAAAAATLVSAARLRYPNLQIDTQSQGPAVADADPQLVL